MKLHTGPRLNGELTTHRLAQGWMDQMLDHLGREKAGRTLLIDLGDYLWSRSHLVRHHTYLDKDLR